MSEMPPQNPSDPDAELPPWMRGPDVSEELKDFFRSIKDQAKRIGEVMDEQAIHYVDIIEKAESPGARKKIILSIMTLEQLERNHMYELLRPDPKKTTAEIQKEVEDLEKNINLLLKSVGLEAKYPETHE